MIVKKTSENQITLPQGIVEQFPGCDHFEIRAEGGEIIMRPVPLEALETVQRKLEKLGITEDEVRQAVDAARRHDR